MVLRKRQETILFKIKLNLFVLIYFSLIFHQANSENLSEFDISNNIDYQNKSSVISLNHTTFENFNSTNDIYFIEFFAPWCGHCKTLKPIYERAARTSEDKGLNCKFAAIDATKNEGLSLEWDVKGYPTIFFVNNKAGKKIKYEGSRTEKGFIDFIITYTKEFKQEKHLIQNEDQFIQKINNFERNQFKNYLIIFGNENLHENKFNQFNNIQDFLLNYFENIHIFVKNEENKSAINEILTKYLKLKNENYNENDLYLFSRLYNRNSKAYEEFELLNLSENEWNDLSLLKNALNLYRFPIFSNSTEELITYSLETGVKNLVVFYDDGKIIRSKKSNKTESEIKREEEIQIEKLINENRYLTPEFINDVKKYILNNNLRKEFLFSFSPLDNPDVNILVDVLKLSKKQLPLLLLTKTKEGTEDDLDKFKIEKTILSKDTLSQFIEDFKQDKMSKFFTSDELPKEKTDENGVYKIVGLNFDEFLSNNDKDIALFVCSKFSKNCKKFSPILKNVAKIFKGNSDLLIGETDPHYNEYTVDIKLVYPSLIFLPKATPNLTPEQRFKNSVLYDDAITTKNIKEFILENSRFKLTQNNIGNETLIYMNEIKPENIVKPIIADEGKAAEEDIEYESMLSEIGGDAGELADLFKSIGGDFDLGNLGAENEDTDEMSAFKDMFSGLGKENLEDIDFDKLKNVNEFDNNGENDDINNNDNIEKLKDLFGEKIGDQADVNSLNHKYDQQEEFDPNYYNFDDKNEGKIEKIINEDL